MKHAFEPGPSLDPSLNLVPRPSLFQDVVMNHYGYFERIQKPTAEALADYYTHHYYQEKRSVYDTTYTPEEHEARQQKLTFQYETLKRFFPSPSHHQHRLLELGSGEGWVLRFFKSQGWTVQGLDFTALACQQHNPDCVNDLQESPILDGLQSLIKDQHQYDVIWVSQTLEQVLDPDVLIRTCQQLSHPSTLLFIEAAHNFSPVQQDLYNRGLVNRVYWVEDSDHLSFFNPSGLKRLCALEGWKELYTWTDYFIDMWLYQPDTNYINHPDVGPACYEAHQRLMDLLHSLDRNKTLHLLSQCAELGLGRTFCSVYKPHSERS